MTDVATCNCCLKIGLRNALNGLDVFWQDPSSTKRASDVTNRLRMMAHDSVSERVTCYSETRCAA